MTILRTDLIGALHAALETDPRILAAWLGGSDASGRIDEHSDVDLLLAIGDEEDPDHAFTVVERCLDALGGYDRRHRLTPPTWHGHEQAFYRLREAAPETMLDLVVMRASAEGKLLEPERHGSARILFDRAGVVKPEPLDRPAHEEKVRAKLRETHERFDLFQPLVEKAVARGHLPEAVHFYQNLTLRPLVDLLRIKHCPDRFDFGLRYLDRDLPASEYALITRLCLAGDADTLLANAKTAREKAGGLLNELVVKPT